MDHTSVATFAVSTTKIPGWYVWQSEHNRLWHARKKDSDPPVLVHGNNEEDLRDSVRAYDGGTL